MTEEKAYRPKGLTYKVHLPGGQQRLAEAILFVCEQSEAAPRFGLTKLNKIIWRADFTAYASRRVPVTGRAYQKLQFGPAPIEMRPLLGEMRNRGEIEFENTTFGNDIVESRVITNTVPNLRFFSVDDLEYLKESIQHYWDKTGRETSDESHGIGWKTREDGDPMPYELAFLSDEPLTAEQTAHFNKLAHERYWVSR